VAREVEMGNIYRVLVGKPRGKNHLLDQCIKGLILLKWTLK
jgi:hypothetical protein